MGVLHEADELPWVAGGPGIARRVLAGEQLMLVDIRIEAGQVVPLHTHPHEQIGRVLEGRVWFRIGEDERMLGPGGVYSVLSGEEHSARAADDSAVRLVEVFTPPREDFR